VHQRMNRELWQQQQQQQQAREEAAKLKEMVKTALAKAIGWATAAGSYGSQLAPNQTQVLQTIPDSVLETPNSAPEANQNSEPQNKFINIANQNMVPQTNPNSVPQTNQNSVPQTSNTLAHQANPIRQLPNSTSKCRKSIQKSTKNFQKRSKFSRQKFRKFRQISMSKNVIRMVLGRPRKKFSHKNKISNKIPKKRKEKSH
jgi:hypothetical protein